MSFTFESTRVQRPQVAPTTSNPGATYRFAHRRLNLDGQHSLWREGPTTLLPADLTPESYGDTYLKDEFVMSEDNGVTWQIVTAAANHTGTLTVSAFNAGWSVTTDTDNQQSFLNSATLGTFSATESPSREFYLVNQGSSVATLSFNIIDTVTELIATQYSGQVQLALEGVFFSSGNGNPNTTYNQTLLWATPPQSLNAFSVAFPNLAFIKFTLTLTNFPQGGIQSSSVDFGLEFVANATKFPIGLDHVWLKGTRLIDAQAGFLTDLITTPSSNNLEVAPFAVNINGTAYYQAATLTFLRTPGGSTNYRLQATSESVTQIVESTEALPLNAISLATFDFDGTTVSNIIYIAPIRTVDYGKLVDATIARGRFISINASGEPSLATSAAETIGVSLFTDSGYYTRSGLVWLESSAAISVGDFLEPNGSGLAATASSGPAIALSAATGSGQFILADFRAASGGSGGGGGSPTLGSLIDVDLITNPPTDQQALIYDLASNLWIPGSVAAGGGRGGIDTIYAAKKLAGETLTSSASAIDITGINDETYDYIEIDLSLRSDRAARDFPTISLNGDTTGSNYARHFINNDGTSLSSIESSGVNTIFGIPGTTSPANYFGSAKIKILDPSSTSKFKTIEIYGLIPNEGSNTLNRIGSIVWQSTAAITSVNIGLAFNFIAGSQYTAKGYKEFQFSGSSTQIKNEPGTAYTLQLSDAGANNLLELEDAVAVILTVPDNATVAFPIGSTIPFIQQGAGRVAVLPGLGVTVNSADSHLLTRTQYSAARLIKRATNEWTLIGDIAAI